MSDAASLIAASGTGQLDGEDLDLTRLHRQNRALRSELDQVEPVISASLLVATAFRLRDQKALVSALRLLVRAIRLFEADRGGPGTELPRGGPQRACA